MHPLLATFDAEDSPGALVSHRSENIHREERRFLIGSGQSQRQALKDGGVPFLRSYSVCTLYLEPLGSAGTWSLGKSQIKFRLRKYNQDQVWWFELKTNVAGMVDKHRRQVTASEIDSLGFKPVVMVTYSREEYESGSDALDRYENGQEDALTQWLRVTIDTDVTALQVPRDVSPSRAMRAVGRPLATLKNRVLEVKTGHDQVPMWLPLPTYWNGSKSRFSVAALWGMPNLWAPSYNLQSGRAKAVA